MEKFSNNIPKDIWDKLTPDQRKKIQIRLKEESDKAEKRGHQKGKQEGINESRKLTNDERKSLALIYNEVPTYSAQPTKERSEFDLFIANSFTEDERIRILKSLSLLDPQNGAKMISDIVEREKNARVIFVKNCGLLF